MGTIFLRTRLLSTLFVLIALAIGTVKGQSEQIPWIYSADWSKDGSTFAIATRTELTIFNADFSVRSTWRQTNSDDPRRFGKLSPNGDKILTDNEVWDTVTFQPIFIAEDYYLGEWSADGNFILAVPKNLIGFVLLSGSSGQVMQNYLNNIYLRSRPILSPDNQHIAVIDDHNNIYLVDRDTGQQIIQTARTRTPTAFAWHPESHQFVFTERMGEPPNHSSAIYSFDTQTHQVTELLIVEGYVTRIRWSPDGQEFVVDTVYELYIVNTETLEYQIYTLPTFTNDVVYSPWGGQIMLSFDVYRSPNLTAANNLTNHEINISYSLMNGTVQFVVPSPSLARLDAILEHCVRETRSTTLLNSVTIPSRATAITDFVAQIESLPADAIPPACRVDLLAVAHALRSQP